MYLHPLDPSVKCQICKTADIVFVRTRSTRDLYCCTARIRCKAYTVHTRRLGEDCGVGVEFGLGVISAWVNCAKDAVPAMPSSGSEGTIMPSKGINQDMEITNVLRHVGRWFQAGKSIDIPALCRLIEARREQRPELCAALTNLIQAINDAIAHGDRAAALEHFRNAIELARKTSEGR